MKRLIYIVILLFALASCRKEKDLPVPSSDGSQDNIIELKIDEWEKEEEKAPLEEGIDGLYLDKKIKKKGKSESKNQLTPSPL